MFLGHFTYIKLMAFWRPLLWDFLGSGGCWWFLFNIFYHRLALTFFLSSAFLFWCTNCFTIMWFFFCKLLLIGLLRIGTIRFLWEVALTIVPVFVGFHLCQAKNWVMALTTMVMSLFCIVDATAYVAKLLWGVFFKPCSHYWVHFLMLLSVGHYLVGVWTPIITL